jgi:hypothetical protein
MKKQLTAAQRKVLSLFFHKPDETAYLARLEELEADSTAAMTVREEPLPPLQESPPQSRVLFVNGRSFVSFK